MKPKPRTRRLLDYSECTNYIEKKYGIDTRDYAGKFGGDSGFRRWVKVSGESAVDWRVDIKGSQEQWSRFTADVKAGKFIDPPYQDFWHWLIDVTGLTNGSAITLGKDMYDSVKEPWQKEILDLYIKEFGDGKEYDVSW